ncbi:MAG: type II toxin-antitoxin system CcdA family antitoxin [Ramlibacter sp.]|nr:type II toxin-antitoxin system CcdA family antitoxin [Ramlibacter sp.]
MAEPALARKRAINLSLSEHLIDKARQYSTNLSATVDTLLAGYVEQQQHERASHQQWANDCAAGWNAVHEKVGSFADEHSTL